MVRMIAFETASLPGSLALLEDGQVMVDVTLPASEKTTKSFARIIREALRQADWQPDSINVFAVCQGPGSFTGLRIGITMAKIYAYVNKAKVVAVNTLRVIAAQAQMPSGSVWAVMDAQRNQVFAAEFQAQTEVQPTRIYDGTDWVAKVSSDDFVIGDGAKKYLNALPKSTRVASPDTWNPKASTLGLLGYADLRSGLDVDLWALSPAYFRKSAAEEKLQ